MDRKVKITKLSTFSLRSVSTITRFGSWEVEELIPETGKDKFYKEKTLSTEPIEMDPNTIEEARDYPGLPDKLWGKNPKTK